MVEPAEEEEAGMELAKGERLSWGRAAPPWCGSSPEGSGVLHTARSAAPSGIGSLLLV